MKFFVVLNRDVEKLNKMEWSFKPIKEKRVQKLDQVSIGEICLVFLNKSFHRCKVLQNNIAKNTIIIQLIDYGEIRRVMPGELWVIFLLIYD